MLCLGVEKMPLFVAATHCSEIFLRQRESVIGQRVQQRGRNKGRAEPAGGVLSRRHLSTGHFPGKQTFVGKQRSCVGFGVVQTGMEICWPEALLEGGHCGTRVTFVFSSFCLLCL